MEGDGWRVEGDGWRVEGDGWRVKGDGWRGGWRVMGEYRGWWRPGRETKYCALLL